MFLLCAVLATIAALVRSVSEQRAASAEPPLPVPVVPGAKGNVDAASWRDTDHRACATGEELLKG